jgi:glycosyltransferase involved in cell wall biosynthesis
MKNKILLIGPLSNKKNPEKTGGAIVAFTNLLEELNRQNVHYLVVDTLKKNYPNILFAYVSIFGQIFIKQFQVKHLSLHSSKDYLFFAPYLILIGKLFGRTTSLRKYAGDAWDIYVNAKGIKKKILNYIFKNVDYLFLEQRFLVEKFKNLNKEIHWFPNVRSRPNLEFQDKKFNKRFVFMSHIKKEKGMDEIIEVRKLLNDDYVLDIYGVIDEMDYTKEYLLENGMSYKGAVKSTDVLPVLSTYDVLLLPSYKEGYPGIVIEAYSIGLPIVATSLIGLQEITDQYETGILIDKKNVNQLKSAIEYFNDENYKKMSKFAKKKFENFDSEMQSKKFIDTVLQEEA